MVSSAHQEVAVVASTAKFTKATTHETARDYLTLALARLITDYSSACAAFGKSHAEAQTHALRIAARKLRGAVVLINSINPSISLKALAQDVKATAKALAELRELDVLIGQLNAFDWPARHAVASKQLIEAFEQLRNNAVAGLLTADICSKTPPLNVEDFAAAEFNHPARDVAAELLDSLLRRTRKKAKKLKSLADEQRHKLRIAIKNLRYGIELFGRLFDDNKNFQRYLKRASKLQVELGTCNDAATARRLLSEIMPPLQPDAQKAAACFLKTLEKQAHKAVNTLPKRWHHLQQQEPFWQ